MQRRRGPSGEANSDADDEPARAGVGTNNYDHHLVDAQDFRNMKLAIGTVERSIFEMSLSDNLTGTRHIDIRLRQNVGNVAGPDEQAVVVEPGSGNGSRLKITVAADEPEPDADAKYLDKMRGWLMTVAALFVGIAFQAAIQPPQWVLGAVADYANTLASGAPAAAPSPLSAAHQRATNKVTGEARRAGAYYGFNALAFAEALSVLLVLVLVQRTPAAAGRAVNAVKYMMPNAFVAVLLTFFVAMSTNWRMTIGFGGYYLVYGAFLTAYILGKLGACKEKLRRLFRR